MVFESKNLYSRKLELSDLDDLIEMQENEKVMKYIIGRPKTPEETKEELENIVKRYDDRDKTVYILALIEKATDKFIGTCSFIKSDDNSYEIGYRLNEGNWRKGFGKEVVKAQLSYCFDQLSCSKIIAYVYSENIASVKILESFNMKLEEEYLDETLNLKERKYSLKG